MAPSGVLFGGLSPCRGSFAGLRHLFRDRLAGLSLLLALSLPGSPERPSCLCAAMDLRGPVARSMAAPFRQKPALAPFGQSPSLICFRHVVSAKPTCAPPRHRSSGGITLPRRLPVRPAFRVFQKHRSRLAGNAIRCIRRRDGKSMARDFEAGMRDPASGWNCWAVRAACPRAACRRHRFCAGTLQRQGGAALTSWAKAMFSLGHVDA